MKIIITEKQLDLILTDTILTEDKHQSKEVKSLIDWSIKFMGCSIFPIKNGIKICPPKHIEAICRTTHLSDKALYDIERDLAKWFGVTKHDIHQAFKQWRAL
jgi:hypothetical protein